MRQRRSKSDDVLFISALAAVLIGIILLLVTTHAFSGAFMIWPVLVMAAGGALLYPALVRHASPAFLFGGISFVLEGAFFLVVAISSLEMRRAWPIVIVIAGISGMAAGYLAWRRPRPSYLVPSLSFLFLGLVFSLFSFHIVDMSLRDFIVSWWPSILILGGILLFAAYGLKDRGGEFMARRRGSRKRPPQRGQNREP